MKIVVSDMLHSQNINFINKLVFSNANEDEIILNDSVFTGNIFKQKRFIIERAAKITLERANYQKSSELWYLINSNWANGIFDNAKT